MNLTGPEKISMKPDDLDNVANALVLGEVQVLD